MDEEAIFAQALRKETPEERMAFLDRACAGQPGLRESVESLLAAYHAEGELLELPPAELAAGIKFAPILERPGSVIGPYRLLEQVGEGGMGVVYRAEQQKPVQRQVALKIIKPGMDSQEVIARFEAERQALALMDHTNIAKVLDAGATQTGRPYFVMELVRGVPITEYCDQHRLNVRDRLWLFTTVCQAVQHAHQKGIIHCDIKPSNVLVSQHEGKPVVKVIDFGVAKAINQRLTEQTLFTKFSQFVGTPLYMSPEQADLGGRDIDTRSDIYSLGVLLYELLSGTTPFGRERLGQAAYDEIRRIIREEEPPMPSTRISMLGEAATTVGGHRQAAPKKLSSLVRGDLDWIVMKALEKDRTRRYATANEYAQDILRYLNDEPVQACPPSARYRFRKFARRNRTALITTAIVAMALLAGTALSTWQAILADRARRSESEQRGLAEERGNLARRAEAEAAKEAAVAKQQAAIAEAVLKFINEDLLSQADPTKQADRDLKLRTVLDRASERIAGRFEDQPLVEAAIRRTLATTYGQLGEFETEELHARRALQLLEQQHDKRSELQNLEAMDYLSHALFYQGKLAESEELDRRILEGRQRLLGQDDPRTLISMQNVAASYAKSGRDAEAAKMWRAIIKICAEKGTQPTAYVFTNLAVMYTEYGRYDEAKSMLRQVLAHHDNEHPHAMSAMDYLGYVYRREGRYDEAEDQLYRTLKIQRSVLGDEHRDTRITRNRFLNSIVFNRSAKHAKGAVEICENLLRSNSESSHYWTKLAWAHYRCGAWQDCADAVKKVKEIEDSQQARGETSTYWGKDTIDFFAAMAAWQLDQKQEKLAPWNDRTWSRSPGSLISRRCQDELEHLLLGLGAEYSILEQQAQIHVAQRRFAEAAELYSQMLDNEGRVLGDVNRISVETSYHLGRARQAANQDELAHACFRDALARLSKLTTEERFRAASRLVEQILQTVVLSFVESQDGTTVPTRDDAVAQVRASGLDPEDTLHHVALAERVFHSPPRIVETGWRLDRVIGFRGVVAPRYHEREKCLYLSRVGSGEGRSDLSGVFRVELDGQTERVAEGREVVGLGIESGSGDVFFCEIRNGGILRLSSRWEGRRTWVYGIKDEDSDPCAIAFPPADYTGTLLRPGQAVFVDCGDGGPDEIYRFSLSEEGACAPLYSDGLGKGPLHSPVDIAVGREFIYVADAREDLNKEGGVYRIADGAAQYLPTNRKLVAPEALDWDPIAGELLVLAHVESDPRETRRLLRLDPRTGQVRDVVTNIFCDFSMRACLDVTSDGSMIFLATPNTILVFTRTTPKQR